MATEDAFFPQRPGTRPMIYAYSEDNPKYKGLLKVGFASTGVEKRVAEQFPVLKPGDRKPYQIVFAESAMYGDGGSFTDKRVHEQLVRMGYQQQYHGGKKTEWFRCDEAAVRAAWIAVKNRADNPEARTQEFAMHPEQAAAVEKTLAYYASAAKEKHVRRAPKFLWNAKMRFGKTFASYQLAKRLGAKRVLVLTFKPAVQSAWRDDLLTHVDFEGWQFICRPQRSGDPTADEQRAKANWGNRGEKGENPYAALPRMVMLTYRIPESIQRIARQGEFDEFDLNVFFSAEGTGDEARFVFEDYVQKWLDLIRGSYLETTTDDLKLGRGRPAMPFADSRLLGILTHTLWLLPDVASCQAMANLLRSRKNVFYHDYAVNVCAGASAGIGVAALGPVLRSMGDDPLASKTITLSCGKLTTGVTVRPWTGVFMLRNLRSPETYFQTAFRVQSPWVVDGERGREIIKRECYVFDFALDRALRQISDYSCRLNIEEKNPEKKVGEFIRFLPVIAYDGSSMKHVDAAEILDIAMAGTSATLLARRWESALLVNVDNETLRRLMANEKAMAALMRIEGFRALNQDIETIINKSEHVKKARREEERLTKKERAELTQEEKEFKSKRREIQEKLIKFATRIPVFMYLTDFREYCLEDVITQLEPKLFRKVTGLNVVDFNLLCSLNVFNASLMNDAVYKFKRYEDASLVYTGLESRHDGENVGLFNTTLTAAEYKELYRQQQATM